LQIDAKSSKGRIEHMATKKAKKPAKKAAKKKK